MTTMRFLVRILMAWMSKPAAFRRARPRMVELDLDEQVDGHPQQELDVEQDQRPKKLAAQALAFAFHRGSVCRIGEC
jgi:hypothetical protein